MNSINVKVMAKKKLYLLLVFFLVAVGGLFYIFFLTKVGAVRVSPIEVAKGLNDPRDVAVDSAGDIYFVDIELGILGVVRNGDNFPRTLITGLTSPAGLDFDGSERFLYFTERLKGVIRRIEKNDIATNPEPPISATDGRVGTILTRMVDTAGIRYVPGTDSFLFTENTCDNQGKIKRYNYNTGELTTILTGLDCPWAAVEMTDGTIVFTILGAPPRVGVLKSGETVPTYYTSWGPVYGGNLDANNNLYFTLQMGNSVYGYIGEIPNGGFYPTGIFATGGNMRALDVSGGYLYWGEQAGQPNGRIMKIKIPQMTYSQIIDGTVGGTIETEFGDTITFPAGAFTGTQAFNLTIGGVNQAMDNPSYTIFPRSYNFSPSYDFKKSPATVTFSYLKEDLLGKSASTLRVYKWNDTTKVWELVGGTVDDTAKTLTVSLDSFTTLGVMAEGDQSQAGAPDFVQQIEWLPPLSAGKVTTEQNLNVRFAIQKAGKRIEVSGTKFWFGEVAGGHREEFIPAFGNGVYSYDLKLKDYSWIKTGAYQIEVDAPGQIHTFLRFNIKGSGKVLGVFSF